MTQRGGGKGEENKGKRRGEEGEKERRIWGKGESNKGRGRYKAKTPCLKS